MILVLLFCALFAPYVAPHPEDKDSVNFAKASQSPSWEHPMGTDTSGRDILSRVLFGSRISLQLSVIVITIAVTIGTTVGVVAGYWGGIVQTILMRTTDVFLAIPPIVLALAIAAALEPTLYNAMIAIAFGWWTWYARLVQGEVISIKEEEYVEASESIGMRWYDVAFKEILPNILSPITVKATLDMGAVILVGAALAFLGLGAQPPTPSWGAMIAQGRDNVTNFWWIATFPGLAISWAVLAFNLLGDGLRDIFDVEVE